MKCRNCGSEISDGNIFCFVCGEKVTPVVSTQKTSNSKNFNIFKKASFDNLKKTTSKFSKSTMDFVENTGATISNTFKDNDDVVFEKYGYDETIDYLRKNNKTKIAFPASDSQTRDKLDKLFSGEVIGTGAGLVGAAATIGLIGSTLGAGLIIIGAGALIGGVLNSHYEKMMWVPTELFIKDEELVVSGKFSICFDEIKHVSTKIVEENEMLVLTLTNQAIEFRTYNAGALKTVIDEKLAKFNQS